MYRNDKVIRRYRKMIERIREYLEDRMIKKVLKKSAADIFIKDMEFKYLENKYCKNKSGVNSLLIYCILEIASKRTPFTKGEKFNCVKNLFLDKLELMLETETIESIVEIQQLEAKTQFLETKLERLSAKKMFKIDEYSFSSMQYKMENACKGSIPPEQYEFIKSQSKKIAKTNEKIMILEAKRNQN